MAKRFTDTEKFIDPWFRRLSSKHKLLWDFLCCNCTHAGIICVDLEFVEMVLSEKFEDDVLQKHFSERLVHIEKNKWFIPKFISFQYGELNSDFRIHKQIIRKLEKEGINPLTLQFSSRTITDNHEQSMKVHESSHGVKEQEQEKEQEQDSSFLNKYLNKSELVNTNPAPKKNLPSAQPLNFRNSKDSPIKPDSLIEAWNGLLTSTGKLSYCYGLSGDDLRELLTTLSFSEFQKIETWNKIFSTVSKSDFLNGSSGSFVATLNWIVKHSNALKVLNGQYSGTPDAQKPAKKAKTTATPDNPTGNPYRAQRIANGEIA